MLLPCVEQKYTVADMRMHVTEQALLLDSLTVGT